MKKKVLTTMILSAFITTLGGSIFLESPVMADEIKSSQSQINEEIKKNNTELKNLIENWDEIHVMSDDEYKQKEAEKLEALQEYADENPELQKNLIQTISTKSSSSSSIGSTGDILITPYGESSSGGSFSGHAGIVDLQWRNAIESYPADGVQRRVNDWKTRYPKVIGGSVKNSEPKDYLAASKYAASKIGCSYNKKFGQKRLTNKFYCSQLVWRAWYEQGYDLDKDGGDYVLPTDLISNKLDVFYKSY
ncbi:hydrolase [Clostridium botulinum]|nr:hydrolase [Clostridium botulinum]